MIISHIITVIVFIIIATMAPDIISVIIISVIIVTRATIKANPHSSYLSSSKLDLNWRKPFIIIIITTTTIIIIMTR